MLQFVPDCSVDIESGQTTVIFCRQSSAYCCPDGGTATIQRVENRTRVVRFTQLVKTGQIIVGYKKSANCKGKSFWLRFWHGFCMFVISTIRLAKNIYRLIFKMF